MKPDYYNSMRITPIEYITANKMDFCTGNIIKYASRWDMNGTPLEDLRKIVEYANILIEGELIITDRRPYGAKEES